MRARVVIIVFCGIVAVGMVGSVFTGGSPWGLLGGLVFLAAAFVIWEGRERKGQP